MKFSKAQEIAVQHKDGPMLVLAGPGSGKTFTITMRIKYLIENGVKPENILVITFTKAAATEMKERFVKLMNGEGRSINNVTFGTFHAVFFTILKYAYNFSAANIIRDEDRYLLIKQAVSKHEIEIEDENEFLTNVLGEIGRVKSECINLDNYYSTNCPAEAFRKIYADYEAALKSRRLIDFDDMLVYTYELLSQRPDILKAWQGKYRYVLIDEFQDINKVQYDTIRLLAAPENNLFIVGDDDQSIYGFRGSKPELMLNFSKDYPDARQVVLDINFRSTGNIVEAAGRLIGLNSKRYKKNIQAVNDVGSPIIYKQVKDFIDEYTDVADQIRMLCTSGKVGYQDVAVLYRSNTGIGSLARKLMENNIPFRIKDKMRDIFEHWIAKDIFAYIRIATGQGNRNDFIQIMNRPKRYIGRDYLTDTEINLDNLCKYYEEKPWMVDRIEKLKYDLKLLKGLNPYAAVNYIRRGIGYDEYISEYAINKGINLEELTEVLNEIHDSAREHNSFEEWYAAIDEYRRLIREIPTDKGNLVTLTTMHSSKGLEFDTVFIIDATEGSTPHKKATLDSDMEEERRMFYVAMTRAKSRLYIYSTAERYNKKTQPSRFVVEAGLTPPPRQPAFRGAKY